MGRSFGAGEAPRRRLFEQGDDGGASEVFGCAGRNCGSGAVGSFCGGLFGVPRLVPVTLSLEIAAEAEDCDAGDSITGPLVLGCSRCGDEFVSVIRAPVMRCSFFSSVCVPIDTLVTADVD